MRLAFPAAFALSARWMGGALRRRAYAEGAMFRIRPATPADRAALYDICLRTADSGEDGSHLFSDPELVGHVSAGPYLAHEPGFAFVLEDEAGVGGYVLGALDTRRFAGTLEREWWPGLRGCYPQPTTPPEARTREERLRGLIHRPAPLPEDLLGAYPSHLHIDLLPRAQGQGQGKRLLRTLFGALRGAGSPGVHLGVGGKNARAQAFYEHVGFQLLRRDESGGAWMGWRLAED